MNTILLLKLYEKTVQVTNLFSKAFSVADQMFALWNLRWYFCHLIYIMIPLKWPPTLGQMDSSTPDFIFVNLVFANFFIFFIYIQMVSLQTPTGQISLSRLQILEITGLYSGLESIRPFSSCAVNHNRKVGANSLGPRSTSTVQRSTLRQTSCMFFIKYRQISDIKIKLVRRTLNFLVVMHIYTKQICVC